MSRAVEAARFSIELARAACVIPLVAAACRVSGPEPLVRAVRAIGAFAPRRDARGRARLKRAIGAIDARLFLMSKSSRCYRRSLVEIALDRGASEERLHLGVSKSGEEGSGHAWLESDGPGNETYDMEIVL